MSKIPIFHSIRLISQADDYLNKREGSKGEIFYNKDSDSLTLFNGQQIGGIDIARSDLTNVTDASFLSKASSAGLGNTTVSVSGSTPQNPSEGNLWLNTSNNLLYVYVSDQWIVASFSGNYNDLTNKPSLFSGSYNDLTNKPDLSVYQLSANAFSGNYNDLTNKPSLFSGNYNDLTNRPTLAAVATSGDYDDLTNLPSLPSLGSVTFTGTVVDSADSSNITFTPAVNFSSDINVDNDVFVNNTIFTNSINISGVITAQGSGTPEITSDNEILINPGTTTILNGLTTFYQTTEVVNTKTGATGTVVHDFSTGSLFLHANIAANFTANIINVPTTNDRSTSVAMILDQGATPYIPNAVQIDGSAQTIKWSGGSEPSGTANYLDIVNFTLIRSTNSWTVIGSLSTYN